MGGREGHPHPEPVLYVVTDHRAENEHDALVRACLCVCDHARAQAQSNPRIHRAWAEGLHRVIVLRARGPHLARIAELPGACAQSVGAHRVVGLGPIDRADVIGPLRRARLLSVPHAHPSLGSVSPERLALRVVEGLNLSLGKLIVQCAHAITLHALADPLGHRRWVRAGRPLSLEWCDPFTFSRACARVGALVVRDAGLTELTPGTATVAVTGGGVSGI